MINQEVSFLRYKVDDYREAIEFARGAIFYGDKQEALNELKTNWIGQLRDCALEILNIENEQQFYSRRHRQLSGQAFALVRQLINICEEPEQICSHDPAIRAWLEPKLDSYQKQIQCEREQIEFLEQVGLVNGRELSILLREAEGARRELDFLIVKSVLREIRQTIQRSLLKCYPRGSVESGLRTTLRQIKCRYQEL